MELTFEIITLSVLIALSGFFSGLEQYLCLEKTKVDLQMIFHYGIDNVKEVLFRSAPTNFFFTKKKAKN